MKSYFSHIGEAFEEIKQIYDSLPRSSSQKPLLKQFALKLASFNGEWQNLAAIWPEVVKTKFSGFYQTEDIKPQRTVMTERIAGNEQK
jgi:hypothetical protein